jgi:hypothetical protein
MAARIVRDFVRSDLRVVRCRRWGALGEMGVSGSEKNAAGRLLPIANRAEGPCAYVREVCLDGERGDGADSGCSGICAQILRSASLAFCESGIEDGHGYRGLSYKGTIRDCVDD